MRMTEEQRLECVEIIRESNILANEVGMPFVVICLGNDPITGHVDSRRGFFESWFPANEYISSVKRTIEEAKVKDIPDKWYAIYLATEMIDSNL